MSKSNKFNNFFNSKGAKLFLTLFIIAAITVLATWGISSVIKNIEPKCPTSLFEKDNKCYNKECSKPCDIDGQTRNWDSAPECKCECPNGTKVGTDSTGNKKCLPLCGNNVCLNPDEPDSCLWLNYSLNIPREQNTKICKEHLPQNSIIYSSLPENDGLYVACYSGGTPKPIGSVFEDTTYCYYGPPPKPPSSGAELCPLNEANGCFTDIECQNVIFNESTGEFENGTCSFFNASDWRNKYDIGYCVNNTSGEIGKQFNAKSVIKQNGERGCSVPDQISINKQGSLIRQTYPCNHEQNLNNKCNDEGGCIESNVCKSTGWCANTPDQDVCTTSGIPCSSSHIYDKNQRCCKNEVINDVCGNNCDYPAILVETKGEPGKTKDCTKDSDCDSITNVYNEQNIKSYCGSDTKKCMIECGQEGNQNYKCIDLDNGKTSGSFCNKQDGGNSVCKYGGELPLIPNYNPSTEGGLVNISSPKVCYYNSDDKSSPNSNNVFWKNQDNTNLDDYELKTYYPFTGSDINYCNDTVINTLMAKDTIDPFKNREGVKSFNIDSKTGNINTTIDCKDINYQV